MSFLLEVQKVKRRLDETLIEAKVLLEDEIERRASNDTKNLSKVS